jgi:hypothetical protein
MVFFFNPLPGASLYQECLDRKLITEGQSENNQYALCSISDQDWTPEILRKMIWREYWHFTIRLLLRKPGKYIGKYVWCRITRRDRLKTLLNWSLDMVYRTGK